MNNQCSPHYPKLCEFKDAEMAFFPIFKIPKKNDLYFIPDTIPTKEIVGIAELLPIVSHRLILNAIKNGTTFHSKIPLGFSLFPPADDQSPEKIIQYWNKLKEVKKSRGHMTLWNIVPSGVYDFIFNEIIQGKGLYYYHDPAYQTERHQYAITNVSRIKAHLIKSPAEFLMQENRN